MLKTEIKFGHGDVSSIILRDPNYFNEPSIEAARVLGWANGCPVVEEMIASRGVEKMIPRYRGVNMWFRRAHQELKNASPSSKPWLVHDKVRSAEPGKYESKSVPIPEYREAMSPMNTLVGFALPRLLAEQAATGAKLSPEEERRRTGVAMASLKVAAGSGRDDKEVMAITAEQIRRHGDLEPEVILQQILPANWLVENPEPRSVEILKDRLRDESRELYQLYKTLTPARKKALGVA